MLSAKLLGSACSCAQRVQLSLEGLGGASNLLLLVGVGANFLASYLSRLTAESLSRTLNDGPLQRARGFASCETSGGDLS